MHSEKRQARVRAASALCACAGLLTACGNPFSRANTPEISLVPTRTPAPAQAAAPTPTLRAPTPTPELDIAPTATAQTAQAAFPACSDAKPAIAAFTPPPAESLGQIAFITTNNDIVLTDLDGRLRIDLTDDAFVSEDGQAGRVYQFPTFSSDGKHVAFTSLYTTQDFDGITSTVHVAPAIASSTVTDLYATAEWSVPYLDWSPDNQQIAFLTISQDDGAIRVVNRAGGEVSIFDTGSPSYWHWRADSSGMLTHLGGRASRPGGAYMAVIESSGAAKDSQTKLDELPGNFQSPHWAPDARHMLYVANTGEADELVVADAVGKALCTLAPVESNAFFAWSPDGTRVAVLDSAAPVSEPAALTVHDLTSGESRVVHERASTFFWSPDSANLAVYSVVLDAPITRLSAARGKLNAPAAQSQSRSAALRLEVIDAASGSAIRVADTYPSRQFLQYLQFFDQYSRAVTPWSPDGKHLVFSSTFPERGLADVAIASFNDARSAMDVRRIAAGTVAFWSPK